MRKKSPQVNGCMPSVLSVGVRHSSRRKPGRPGSTAHTAAQAWRLVLRREKESRRYQRQREERIERQRRYRETHPEYLVRRREQNALRRENNGQFAPYPR